MSESRAARRAGVWVSSLHTGGCSACAQSLAALEATRYARRLASLGVTFCRVPQQSDILLLCGALTEQARASVNDLIAGSPRPRALVAVGDCAINGCVFAGSGRLVTPLAQTFNVNVEIGGCPPTPPAIIDAIGEASHLLREQSGDALVEGAPVTPTVLPPTPSAPSVPLASPVRAARLAALIEAASTGWEDEDDDAHAHDVNSNQETIENEHTTGSDNGASASATRQQEEKRR